MRKLTFTNSRGESVVLGNSAPFLVTRLEGAGAVGADIQTQKSPHQDGSTFIDAILEPRMITLEGSIMKRSGEEIFACRRQLASVFNSKLGPGKLIYQYDGGEKEIDAVADGAPVFPDRSGQPTQKFLINLLCPDPYWMDDYEESEEMAAVVGGMSFPLSLGTMFSLRGSKLAFSNTGDVDTPVIIEFNGPATNPKVTNVSLGEFIKVNRELQFGDKLIITTAFGNKQVFIEKSDGSQSNVFNWIDLESTFWQLAPGVNMIEYSADVGKEEATVLVKWRNRYVGV